MSDAPHTPAAFINAIAEEGSKKEAIEWLQKTWNERCQLERENEALRKLLVEAAEQVDREFHQNNTSSLRKCEIDALFKLHNTLAALNKE